MKLCKCAEDYTKQLSLLDFGLVKLCACSAGVVAGLFIPKKCKNSVLAAASLLFSISLFPLMFKLVKTIANSR